MMPGRVRLEESRGGRKLKSLVIDNPLSSDQLTDEEDKDDSEGVGPSFENPQDLRARAGQTAELQQLPPVPAIITGSPIDESPRGSEVRLYKHGREGSESGAGGQNGPEEEEQDSAGAEAEIQLGGEDGEASPPDHHESSEKEFPVGVELQSGQREATDGVGDEIPNDRLGVSDFCGRAATSAGESTGNFKLASAAQAGPGLGETGVELHWQRAKEESSRAGAMLSSQDLESSSLSVRCVWPSPTASGRVRER